MSVIFYEDWEVIYALSLYVGQDLPHSTGVCVNNLFVTRGWALTQAGTIQQMVLSTKKTKFEKKTKTKPKTPTTNPHKTEKEEAGKAFFPLVSMFP